MSSEQPIYKLVKDRVKPLLPGNLQLFALLYAKLGTPQGPEYLGNKVFGVDVLPRDWITYIKEEQSNFSVNQMTSHLALEYNITARAEAISQHYYKGSGVRYWQLTKSSYLAGFERQRIPAIGGENRYEKFYKQFVVFCIESGYEYWQVGEILARNPGTIRQWANRWGYKEHTRIVTRMPNYTNSKSVRTEVTKEDNGHLVLDPSTHSMKIFDQLADEKVVPTWPLLRKEISLVWKHLISLLFKRKSTVSA